LPSPLPSGTFCPDRLQTKTGKTKGDHHADTPRFCERCVLRALFPHRLHRVRRFRADAACDQRYAGRDAKVLSQSDGPTPGYVTLVVDIEIEPGVMIGRHTHPGIESAYMLDGGFDLPIEGQPTVAFKPGMGVVVPPNTPHAGGKNGDKKTHIVSTYIVEKGKPLASPA
jgi:quercetin dioxygenase-like cupin family protein